MGSRHHGRGSGRPVREDSLGKGRPAGLCPWGG
jgi:hypothetical protein